MNLNALVTEHLNASPFVIAERIRELERSVLTVNNRAEEAAAPILAEEKDLYPRAVAAELAGLHEEIDRLTRIAASLKEPYADELEDIENRANLARQKVYEEDAIQRKALAVFREALATALVRVCKESGSKTVQGEAFDLQLACKPKITVADVSRAFESLKDHVKAERLAGYIDINKSGIDLVAAMVKAKDAADFQHEEAVNKELDETFPGFTLEIQRIPKILEKTVPSPCDDRAEGEGLSSEAQTGVRVPA